jgi:hypothetical protein
MSCEHQRLQHPDPDAGRGTDEDDVSSIGPVVDQSRSRADGKLAFVSYWYSGFIALDLTNPANPVFRGRTEYPANADGDAHSSNYDEARRLFRIALMSSTV